MKHSLLLQWSRVSFRSRSTVWWIDCCLDFLVLLDLYVKEQFRFKHKSTHSEISRDATEGFWMIHVNSFGISKFCWVFLRTKWRDFVDTTKNFISGDQNYAKQKVNENIFTALSTRMSVNKLQLIMQKYAIVRNDSRVIIKDHSPVKSNEFRQANSFHCNLNLRDI